MKIAFFSPYIPKHLGGGEKHLFSMASVTASLGADVTVAVIASSGTEDEWRKQYQQFFGVDLSKVSFERISAIGGYSPGRILWQRQFDYLYLVTDGSFFYPFAKHNILHVQIPFTHQLSAVSRLKLNAWSTLQTNSRFTQRIIEKNWHRKVDQVIYPVVDDACFLAGTAKKQPIILSVGRFFRQLHSKRQDVLIAAFRTLLQHKPSALPDWQLVLVGSIEDQQYYDECVAQAKDLPATFVTNANRRELLDWYAKSTLYWHAAGFEVDEDLHPENVEHFGISTAEAMAARCVPLVVAKGGQNEVIGPQLNEYTWSTPTELAEKSLMLIENTTQLHQNQQKAVSAASKFDLIHFTQATRTLFGL